MKTEFHFGGIRFGVTDGAIPEVDPQASHGAPHDRVGIYIDQEPFKAQPDAVLPYERRAMFYLKPSEARTIASALMTAAQSVR